MLPSLRIFNFVLLKSTRHFTELCHTLRLHEVLMDLQHQQLQQLTDWLDVTEAHIKKMGAQPLGPDLEDIKHQVEEHKASIPQPEPRSLNMA